MSSLRPPLVRLARALALAATTLIIACGVPDYKVPAASDAGNIIPAGTGGTTSGTSSTSTAGASLGGTSNKGSGGAPAATGGTPQLLNDCSSDANCSSFSATKKCNSALRRCVECITTSDCGEGLYCDPADFSCHVGCDSSDACAAVACDAGTCPTLKCDLSTHECVGCAVDADCSVGSTCDKVTKACVPGCNDTAKSTDCPTGWLCCGNTCTNPLSDSAHCTNCVTSCAQPNTNMECVNGACAVASCKDNYLDCDSDWHNGCEVNKLTDKANCGKCTAACSSDQACINGQCGASSCADPNFKNCTNDPTGACTTNILYDVQNCGGCGTVCSSTNATPSCDNGNCTVTCKSGFADCNAKAVDGCEVDLLSTTTRCGSCTNACTNAHGAASCASGQCAPSCLTGFGDCDGDKSNGCEANETSDPTHCGGCSPCNLANATAACTNGACTISACASSSVADCDGTASNGCEANLQTEASHCGSCAMACNSTNGTATCSSGQCGITCTSGFDNCDKSIANGCEVNLKQSVDNCGSCGTKCPDQANGTAICVNGTCGVSNCQKPYGDCDLAASNGCEANTDIDPNNCSGCGIKCVIPHATAKCSAGVCGISTCDPGFKDCNGDIKDGCEVNIQTDVANCNSCGAVCAPANAVGACVANGSGGGTCTITSCKGSFQDCDGNTTNGCEADTSTNVASCGKCGTACSSNHGTPSCSGGACSITCAGGFGNCDGDVANGCEAITSSDVANCGTCGTTCVAQNGTPACLNSACTVKSCSAGFQDCDAKYSNGCEANLGTDLSNCGSCSNVCSTANGTPSCNSGACGIACTGGFGNCDNLVTDGCETNLTTSLQNCGGCGLPCAPANGTGACASGNCTISSCNTGFANCDAAVTNGCETNLTSDPNNCNACGTICTFAHAAATCASRVCTLGACAAGYANCDSAPANGCEISTTNDPAHCGGCSTVCAYANATATCTNSVCGMGACNTGFANCDGNAANGCEVNLTSDVNNCNACGTKCPTTGGTPVCSGTPATCSYSTCGAGLATCPPGGTCATNTTNDVNNCGGCGTKCSYPNAAASCVSSACSMGACTAGYGNCDAASANGCEVNLKTDINNCNACNTKCSTTNGTATCNLGTCQIACNPGYANCDNSVANGCEINTNTSTANCGGCGTVCNSTNGTATCTTGTCGITCNAGYGNCDGSAANGCETNTNTNVNYCGSCSNVCSSTHGTPSCATGVCSIACAAGYGNCDSNASNGCEATLSTDVNNCGGCGTKCSYANASGVCSGSACSMGTCNAGYGNCNASSGDGCETSLATTSNCGSCGNICGTANATPSCVSNACNEACGAGYGNCDGLASNGCEQNISTDVNHCGNCATVCSYANATPACAGGACSLSSCNYLYGNCDSNAANGCEKSLAADTSNCGTCGKVCGTANGTASCSGGGCSIACSAGYIDCDGNNANGCEINKLTDVNNCGACGNVCANGCTNGVCNTPCTGICSNPVVFTVSGSPATCTFNGVNTGSCNSGALGTTNAVCYETLSTLNGGGCSNLDGRTLYVNGTAEPANGNWTTPLPAKRYGGYCVSAAAGGVSYAAFYVW